MTHQCWRFGRLFRKVCNHSGNGVAPSCGLAIILKDIITACQWPNSCVWIFVFWKETYIRWSYGRSVKLTTRENVEIEISNEARLVCWAVFPNWILLDILKMSIAYKIHTLHKTARMRTRMPNTWIFNLLEAKTEQVLVDAHDNRYHNRYREILPNFVAIEGQILLNKEPFIVTELFEQCVSVLQWS